MSLAILDDSLLLTPEPSLVINLLRTICLRQRQNSPQERRVGRWHCLMKNMS